eukprot:GHVU01218555.1.p1 GENE.GHVU01218555.1~~GHVU01218555.1.p1  ORF type:complete len:282 (-),score=28.60 GHVU01218555.1:331-1176(-)
MLPSSLMLPSREGMQAGGTRADESRQVIAPRRALDIAQESRSLGTGVQAIDGLLRHGFITGLIYEIAGEAGTGKTQFALSLAAETVASVSEGGTCYIYTEGTAPTERLAEIIGSRYGAWKMADYLSRVFVDEVRTPEELGQALMDKIPRLVKHIALRMVIIDSIAGLFRGAHEDEDYAERSRLFFKISLILHRIASEYGCWIIITNQRQKCFLSRRSEPSQSSGTPSRRCRRAFPSSTAAAGSVPVGWRTLTVSSLSQQPFIHSQPSYVIIIIIINVGENE